MDVRVKLSAIVESLEFHSDQTTFYLDTDTGKIILVTPDELFEGDEDDPIESYPDWQREGIQTARALAKGHDGNLLELPDRWEINEYRIMEDFCLSLPADATRTDLYATIHGRGAFRRFKDAIQRIGVTDQWFRYRTSRFKTIAVNWCTANEVPYEDDVPV